MRKELNTVPIWQFLGDNEFPSEDDNVLIEESVCRKAGTSGDTDSSGPSSQSHGYCSDVIHAFNPWMFSYVEASTNFSCWLRSELDEILSSGASWDNQFCFQKGSWVSGGVVPALSGINSKLVNVSDLEGVYNDVEYTLTETCNCYTANLVNLNKVGFYNNLYLADSELDSDVNFSGQKMFVKDTELDVVGGISLSNALDNVDGYDHGEMCWYLNTLEETDPGYEYSTLDRFLCSVNETEYFDTKYTEL